MLKIFEKKTLLLVICMCLFLTSIVLLNGCAKKREPATLDDTTIIESLKKRGTQIGVSADSLDYKIIESEFPDADIKFFSNDINAYTAVAQGKLDAYFYNKVALETAVRNGLTGVRVLDKTFGEGNVSAVALSPVSKIDNLEGKINAFLDEVKNDGTLSSMQDKWIVQNLEEVEDILVPQSSDIHLVVGTTGSIMPFSYYKGTELIGYDIELAYRFANWLGATIEFKVYDFTGIVDAALAGDVDCIFANLFITPERLESIHFSHPTYITSVGVLVQDNRSAIDGISNAWGSIVSNFDKTFIREERWKLLLEGIATTILMVLLSIVLGTIFGFALYLICLKGFRLAKTIVNFSVWFTQRIPVVVFLMILYYVIFSTSALSGVAVSTICFSFVFGMAVYNHIDSAIKAIDYGQTEAAYALGYTKIGTFLRVVLPQALQYFMPSYKSEIISIIKSTSVVGYVAVQDLTKMGDIIRSRTFSAFFPLIAVAIIYFVIAEVLIFIVNQIEKKIKIRI